jgi:hypothetical protein
VWQLVVVDSRLTDHLSALKDYMLLGKGDFYQCFLTDAARALTLPGVKDKTPGLGGCAGCSFVRTRPLVLAITAPLGRGKGSVMCVFGGRAASCWLFAGVVASTPSLAGLLTVDISSVLEQTSG